MSNEGTSSAEPGMLSPGTQLLINTVPLNGTQSILHLASHHIVSITGQQPEGHYYPNAFISMEGKEGQHTLEVDTFSTVVAPVPLPSSSTVPVDSDRYAVSPRTAVPTLEVGTSLPALPVSTSSSSLPSHSMANMGQQACNPNYMSVTVPSASTLLAQSVPMMDLGSSLPMHIPAETPGINHSSHIQKMSHGYGRVSVWSPKFNHDLCCNGGRTIDSNHLVTEGVNEGQQISSSSEFVSRNHTSLNRPSLEPNYRISGIFDTDLQNISSRPPSEITLKHEEIGEVNSGVSGLNPMAHSRDFYSDTQHRIARATEPIAGSPPKRLHMDYLCNDDIYRRGGGDENGGDSLMPQDAATAVWGDSSRADDDSGCHDDGPAPSPNPDEPHDVIANLGLILQEKVSADVRMYADSVRQIFMSSLEPVVQETAAIGQQVMLSPEVEEDLYHYRFLLKLHRHAAKITRLILSIPSSSTMGTPPPSRSLFVSEAMSRNRRSSSASGDYS